MKKTGEKMLDINQIETLSEGPGVYLFLNSEGKVIYVGKAKSLKKRVMQYVKTGGDGRIQIPYLQKETKSLQTILVATDAESLLLENNLIKHHQPKYNVLLKDDKTYLAIKVDRSKKWPRIEMVRASRRLKSHKDLFGPYIPSVGRTLESFINDTFRLRRCSDSELANRSRPCLLYDMKKCLAPCTNLCTQEQYEESVVSLYDFLGGKSKETLEVLEKKIEEAAERLDFEKAGELYELQKKLKEATSVQCVDRLESANRELFYLEISKNEIKANGESSLARVGFTRVSIRLGKVLEVVTEIYDEVILDTQEELLEQLTLQYFSTFSPVDVQEVYVDLPLEMQVTLEEGLNSMGYTLKVKRPVRGDALEWKKLAKRNCLHRMSSRKMEKSERYRLLGDLKIALELSDLPIWIECIDTSHISGQHHVASLVALLEGEKEPSLHRKFKLEKGLGDDIGAFREVLKRRLERALLEGKWPNLILIDGGFVHLSQALEVASSFNLVGLEFVAISKESAKHTRGLNLEWIHQKNRPSFQLDPKAAAFQLLQRLRDSAHEAAIKYHRSRRSKAMKESLLDDIPGIGPKKKRELLRIFGSLAAIRKAGEEELKAVSSLNASDRKKIVEFLSLKKINAQ